MSTSPSSPIETRELASSHDRPVRYFDLLPPELVTEILEWIEGEYWHRKRAKNLLALCLTARQFLPEARRLLYRRLVLVGPEAKFKQLVREGNRDNLAHVRRLESRDKYKTWTESEVAELANAVVNLSELWISDNPAWLRPFLGSNLTNLCIAYIYLNDFPLLSFPCVTHLRLVCDVLSRDLILEFPSLKHLTCHSNGGSDHRCLDQLAPQLASFTYNLDNLAALPISVLESPSIFRCRRGWDARRAPTKLDQVLGIDKWDDHPDCIDFLKNSDHSVEAVILPSSLEGSQSGFWATLLETCRHCHIRVVWDTTNPYCPLYDNTELWFFREAEKRLLETQEGGGGAQREGGGRGK